MPKTLDEKLTEEALREIKQEKKEDGKVNYLMSFPNLVDLVENEDHKLEYLIYDPESKKCEVTPVIVIDDKTYEPPPKRLLPHNILFPAKDKVFQYINDRKNSRIELTGTNHIKNGDDSDVHEESDKNGIVTKNINSLQSASKYKSKKKTSDEKNPSMMMTLYNNNIYEYDISLYNDIISYYKERAELPQENLYDLLAIWAFHTYAMERADFSPIIYFLGLPEKGKSRMLKSMIYIARRGLRKISLTDAQILRDCTHIDATLALDMMDLWKKVEKSGSEDVFLNRPERGIDVSRVNRPERGAFADTDYYTVFGPTVFATNETIHEILDTRAIPIVMVNSVKEYSLMVKPEDALPIKERLTAWRASTMGEEWSPVPRIARSRLGDITQPLFQAMLYVNPAGVDALKSAVGEIEKKRLAEKVDTTTGQLLISLLKAKDSMVAGCIKGQLIANYYNEGNSDVRYKIQSRTILNRLRSMGLETRQMGGGNMGVVWNDHRIDALKLEFGIDIENIVTISESSQTTPMSQTSLESDTPQWNPNI